MEANGGSVFSIPGERPAADGPAEVGPPPYYHRADCNICRKQDGLKTGSALLDAPVPGGYIVEGEHFLAEHAPLQSSSAGLSSSKPSGISSTSAR